MARVTKLSATSPSEGGLAAQFDIIFSTLSIGKPKGIYVGGDGDIVTVDLSGAPLTYPGLKGGSVYPFRLSTIVTTGTTATGIVLLY